MELRLGRCGRKGLVNVWGCRGKSILRRGRSLLVWGGYICHDYCYFRHLLWPERCPHLALNETT